MVVASHNPIAAARREKIRLTELPIVDLSCERSEVSRLIVKASQDYGFFKLINHGVPHHIIAAIEDESFAFFAKPLEEKQRAAAPNPFGYGSKTIGFNGDMGEVEYLLLNTTDPISIAHASTSINSHDPKKFSCALSDYIQAVTELACEILDLMAEGLRVHDTSVFSRLIRDAESDSVFRLNHYPPSSLPPHGSTIGFGAHTDPQILTILRSNDVGGLEIVSDGAWVPITPDPTSFCVNVGDALQAMTNGRLVSVRHRVMTNSCKPRLSMACFYAPPLHAEIASLPELVTPDMPCQYRPFTWGEYKKAAYSLRLADSRLELFRSGPEDDHDHDRLLV